MNFQTLPNNQQNSTSIPLQIQKKLLTDFEEQLQHKTQKKHNHCAYDIQTNELSDVKRKKKKNTKRHNSKSPSKKRLPKSSIGSNLKRLTSKFKEKHTKTEDFQQKVISKQQTLKFYSQNQILPLKKDSHHRSSKKTIISDRNMILKSFDQETFIDKQENQSHIFGSLENYLKDSEKIQLKIHKNKNNQGSVCKVSDELSRYEDYKIGDKFLSNVIKRNIDSRQQQQNIKFPSIKSQIKLQHPSKNVQFTIKKNQLNPNRNIFHNDQLSKILAQQPNSISKLSKQQSIKNNQRPKLFRIKTQVIHKVGNFSLQRQLPVKKKVSSKQIVASISSDSSPYKFIPTCNFSLGYYVNSKTQKLSSQLFSNDVIHQCYQNLSKKLLRLSLIRNPNLSVIEKRPKRMKNVENQLGSLKEFIVKEKNRLKIPLAANGFSLQQKQTKKQVSKKHSIMDSIYKYKKMIQLKDKVDLPKIDNKEFVKYSKHLHTENIKDKLRCYTEQDFSEQKGYTENINEKTPSQSNDNLNIGELLQLKRVKKSTSSKIIQNFHDRYYKDHDPEKSTNHKISSLNFSENFIYRWKDDSNNDDWQHKKKLIVKKLGINT